MAFLLPRAIATLRFLLAWLTPWRPAFRTSAIPSNLRFLAHYRDSIGRHIAKYGTHEPLLTRWLANYLRVSRRGLFVDVGGNIGWHALHAARQPAIETVVAIEPDPFNFSLLEQNIKLNGIRNIIAKECAVGAKMGVTRLFRYKGSNLGRHSTLIDYGHGSHTVPMVDLDGVLAELRLADREVTALKIDVVGYEPAVIEGASETLNRTLVIILEYSPELSNAGAFVIDDMFKRLESAQFKPFALRAKGGVVQIKVDEIHDLKGSIDLIWAKPETLGLDERGRESISLREIAEQNMRVKTP
jgi:FkbM family methyltransferase